MLVRHCSWDIECLDIRPSAVVLSIGAVLVEDNKVLDETFYATFETEPQFEVGRTQGESTMKWWAEQSEEAREILSGPKGNVHYGLGTLAGWIMKHKPETFWGYGADFDNVIIGDLYASYNYPRPWGYNQNRCLRTVINTFNAQEVPFKRVGVHHNALDDAISQANRLIAVQKFLGLSFS